MNIFLKRQFYALKSLVIGFLVLAGMLIPFFYSIATSTLLNDNFNSYNNGNLGGQGGWSDDGGRHFVVQDTIKYEGLKAIRCNANENYPEYTGICASSHIATGLNDGTQVFWIYFDSSNNICKTTTLTISGDWTGMTTQFAMSGGICKYRLIGNYYSDWLEWNVVFNQWFPVEMEWSRSGNHFRTRINNGSWSEWQPLTFYSEMYNVYMSMSGTNSNGFIDYLGSFSGYPQYGTKFTPIYPVNCEKNIDADLIFDLKGTVNIGDQDPNNYTSWSTHFINIETGEIKTKTENFEVPLNKNNNYFSYDYTNYNALTSGCWEVTYDLTGYNPNTMEGIVVFDRCQEPDKKTLICDQETTFELPVITECPEPEYDVCEGLELAEKWLCEIKNMAKEILFPTCPKILELKNQINSFKEKFPFNYLNAIKNFFNDIRNSLNEEKAIPITIFGHEANIDFSFWNKLGSVGGLSETFSNIPKDFSRLIMIIGFLTWLLYFVRHFF